MTQQSAHLHYSTLNEAFSLQPRHSVSRVEEYAEEHSVVFFLLKGMVEGPTLWVQAGLHGDEYDGILTCLRLMEQLPLDRLRGDVVICPIVNVSAYQAGTNESPIDSVNLNRVFGQDRSNTYSYRFGAWLAQRIIASADFLVDLHGGGKSLAVCPFAMVAGDNREAYNTALDALADTDLTAVYICDFQSKGMLINEVCRSGVPAVLLESGGGMSWREADVQRHEKSVYAILVRLHLLEDPRPEQKGKPAPLVISKIQELRFDRSGLQRSQAQAGSIVHRGETIIEVASYPDYETRKLICPVDKAIILSIHSAAQVIENGYAAMLGIIE
ncbi:M14 family metallopeptidase [Paenibacillus donghaensis]|uniref:Succinylglutamate desuccinylase/Aspartoacylase catalytic domain-containing protein n=1 Tax=Paenibacillus donghaensis TaxID=414771 RepID=A0A2Z2KJS7_9BACL|nr:M14 family metallopeptidase [Paenibacillus donghaensis]ASA21202.1 hypothetical protein B9T62_10640 [Paenibacillus donghaensis]